MKIKLREIAEYTGAEYWGDGELTVKGVRDINNEESNYISLCISKQNKIPEYIKPKKNRDIALFTNYKREGFHCILHPLNGIGKMMKKILKLFEINEQFNNNIHKTAVIGSNIKKGEKISIGAYCVIGDNVEIGDNSIIFPNVTIYPEVKIGTNCKIHSDVVLRSGVEIGNNVEIDNNASIGVKGFNRGFGEGNLELTRPLTGKIKIDDFVFIGANTILAKGDCGDLIIGEGTKIDSQVYISRNVKIGKYCRIAGQAAIGDEVVIKDEVSVGPQAGLYDKIKIGKKAFIVSKSGVLKDVGENEKVSGIPAVEKNRWLKIQAIIRNLPKIAEKLRELSVK